MSKYKVTADEVQKVIMDYLENYAEDIDDEVRETTNSVVKEAKSELVQTSPKSGVARDTKYYKGWALKNGTKNKKCRYTRVIWNKTNYQLTHLLEFGHATRNGGRTSPMPHIRPVEEKYGVKFADLLEQKIRRSSR